jgi:SAM-dependent methyltransferase
MSRSSLHKTLYKLAWDTRCRNVDVSKLLRPHIGRETTILDAGCGEYGLAAFISAKKIVGVDILPTDAKVENFDFVHGSILTLPFPSRSFSIAASVDVLEHLPSELRQKAVAEVVRTARDAVIITFPCGANAREADERFAERLREEGSPLPDWLDEHLRAPYPEAAEVAAWINAEAKTRGRKATISTHFSENIAVAEFLRARATKSKYLYLLSNFACGALLPLMPQASEQNAYRAIIFAEFSND